MDLIPEPIFTPELLIDLSQITESVLVPVLPESKSTIPSFYTPYWDKGVVIEVEPAHKYRISELLRLKSASYSILPE